MVTVQRYFLYALMLNSFCLSAMEHIKPEEFCLEKMVFNSKVKSIADKIDRDHLNISACECGHLKSLLGSCVSFIKPWLLTDQQCAAEIKKIVFYVSEDMDKEKFLKKLTATHWYVYYLMQHLVSQKVKELKNVTGSTVDALYNDYVNENENDAVKRIVCDEAFKIFCIDLDRISEDLSDIHVSILHSSQGDIQPHSLAMSSDGKYVGAMDYNNTHFIWDTQTGNISNPQDAKAINWIGSKKKKQECYVVKRQDYYAESYEAMDKDFEHRKGVLLLKIPQTTSYLCQRAFDNSLTQEALKALDGSNIVQQIEGFPQDKLKQAIEHELLSLTKKTLNIT